MEIKSCGTRSRGTQCKGGGGEREEAPHYSFLVQKAREPALAPSNNTVPPFLFLFSRFTVTDKTPAPSSPFSGSDLNTQEFVLKKCYHNHLTLLEASKLIDMDHNPQFKLEGIASLITRRSRDTLAKEIQICQEILQGRCVPMERGDHTVKTETDRPSFHLQNDNREERKRYLLRVRGKVKTGVLLQDVFKVFWSV